MSATAGKTRKPTAAMTTSVTRIDTAAISSMNTTPTAIGSGAIGAHTASTSALAFDSSCPVGCRWCHASGSRRYCRVTERR